MSSDLQLQKDKIQLYQNQVYVTDNVEGIVPEFLGMLKGVIDSPDIPLNVSRSYLQADGNVKKISNYITRKVADKLKSLFNENRADFEQKWNDIKIVLEYGMLSEPKFYEKAGDFVLYPTTEDQYYTLAELKEALAPNQTDKNGKLVVLYASNKEAQHSYIDIAKEKGYTYDKKKKVYTKDVNGKKESKKAEEILAEAQKESNTTAKNKQLEEYNKPGEKLPDGPAKNKNPHTYGPADFGTPDEQGFYNRFRKQKDPDKKGKGLDLDKTWLEEHPGVIGGAAQLIGPAYAMLKPYKKTAGMAAASTIAAPSLARVDKSGEIEDARRQQNAMNTYLKNTNLGPGKIIAMQSVATKTADEIAKISQRQDTENRAIKNAEAQIAAEVAGRNQAAQLETSKANMLADINENQYMDERNLGVAEALGKGLAGMSMDQRKLDMQYNIARGLDKTGSLNRYEIMEQLRKQAKNPESSVYQKSEAELQQIASDLGYKVVQVLANDKEEKRFGGMGRKYTSRLGDLSTKRNTTAKQSIQ
jgi:hypothetical protein